MLSILLLIFLLYCLLGCLFKKHITSYVMNNYLLLTYQHVIIMILWRIKKTYNVYIPYLRYCRTNLVTHTDHLDPADFGQNNYRYMMVKY